MTKTIFHHIKKILLTIIGGGGIGLVLLILVYAIPTERMFQNAKASVEIFEQEGVHQQTVYGYQATTLDNYTDAWMMRHALYSGEESLLEKSLHVYRYAYTHGEASDVCESLIVYLKGAEGYERKSYGRYWHGYLVILKPLLFFFDYGDIRQILKITALSLLIYLCILMEKKNMMKFIPAFAAAMVCIEFHSVGMSMQYTWVFMIAMISSILLLKGVPKAVNASGVSMMFLIIGMCTSYFDFLTYPVFTLGIPLTIWAFQMSVSEQKGNRLLMAFLNCVHWAVGYAGLWGLKWIIYSAFTGENLIEDAMQSVLERTAHDVMGEQISYLKTVWENIGVLAKYPYVLACLAALCVLFILDKKERHAGNRQSLVTYLFIAALPFLWYGVSMNHSYVHAYMTYKDLGVTVFAGMCAIIEMKNLVTKRT